MLRPSTKLWVDGYSLRFTVIQQEACIFWAVAIGLSEARKKGAKVPRKKSSRKKDSQQHEG